MPRKINSPNPKAKTRKKTVWMLAICGIVIPLVFVYVLFNKQTLNKGKIRSYLLSKEEVRQLEALKSFGNRSEKQTKEMEDEFLPLVLDVCNVGTSVTIRSHCAYALQKFAHKDDVASLLLGYLKVGTTGTTEQGEHLVRYSAALALARGESTDPKVREVLYVMLEDRDRSIRRQAAVQFHRVATQSDKVPLGIARDKATHDRKYRDPVVARNLSYAIDMLSLSQTPAKRTE